MKKTFFISVAIACSLMVISCKSKKAVTDSNQIISEEPTTPEMEAMFQKLLDTQLPYTWFSASGTGKIDWDGQRMSARV
ncbi:MAG TPA: hypothetical protein VGK46_05990, partial [Saprospiraceae bacterium]